MNNFTNMNSKIAQAHADLSVIGDNDTRATLEIECAEMYSRGQARLYMNDLAASMSGTFIAKLNDVVTEEEITPYITDSSKKPTPQSLNGSLKMVAVYSLIQSGYTNAQTIETALVNWFEQDGINTEQKLCFTSIAADLIEQLKVAELVEQEEGQAFLEGAYFNVYGLTAEYNELRFTYMSNMWNKSEPKMTPMRHPVTWKTDGTCELPNLKLVKGKSKPKLAFIEAINKMNHTGYRINTAIRAELELWIENEAEHAPEMVDDEKVNRSLEAKHDAKCAIIMDLLELPINETFYFAHTSDWRGRVYPRGGLTQYQSIKEAKAIFDFAKEVEIKDTTGLYIQVANAHDMDKVSINDRIQWVKDNHAELMAGTLANNFYAKRAALALREVAETGKTAIICHIDGTCNGTQWTAAMYRDTKTGEHVNIMKADLSDLPRDLYGVIAEAAEKLATGKERAAFIKFGRGLTKTPIMTLGYGASEQTLIKGVTEYLRENEFKADSKKVVKAIMTAIKRKAPSLIRLTNNLKRILKANPMHKLNWSAYDLEVVCQYLTTEHMDLKGNSYTAKLLGKALPDEEALRRGISPNYVHSLDSAHVRAIVRESKVGLSCIHDSIGCPANMVMETNKIIRTTFHHINKIDLVENIYNALGANYTAQNGELDINEVLESPYIFS